MAVRPGQSKARLDLAQIVTVVTAIAIAASVLLATVVITTKLGTTEANLQHALDKDPAVCADAGAVKTYCLLDQDLTERRYVLAASGVTGALWTRYFTCIGGLIMVAVGAVFILMKLEIKQGEAEAKGAGWGLGLKTTSPGLALALMGGGLLAAAAYTPAKFEITDGPSFLRPIKPPDAPEDPEVSNMIGRHGPPPVIVETPTPTPSAKK